MGSGGIIETDLTGSLTCDDLILNDNAIISWHHVNGISTPLQVGKLTADNNVNLELVGTGKLSGRIRLINFETGVNLESANWNISGASPATQVILNNDTSSLDLVTTIGTIMLIH